MYGTLMNYLTYFNNITDLFIVEGMTDTLKRNMFWKYMCHNRLICFVSSFCTLQKLMWILFLVHGIVGIGWISDISYLFYCKDQDLR